MKFHHILFIVATGILIPIVVNLILLCHNPFPIIEIVGNKTNWLAFYGSYAGGILSAVVSIAILYYTLINSFNQSKIDRQERQIHFLSLDLGERCSHINFMTIINEVVTKSQNINQELYDLDNHRLSTLYETVNSNVASAMLVYNGGSTKEREFVECYAEALNKIGKEIQTLQNKYMILAMAKFSEEAKNAFLVSAISSLNELRNMQNTYYPLINRKASEIIEDRKQRLLELDSVKFF